MSEMVAEWLRGLSQDGADRRRQMDRVRRQSVLALQRAHDLLDEQQELILRNAGGSPQPATPAGTEVPGAEMQDAAETNVLDQVQKLLDSADVRVREQWDDNDLLVYVHLQAAWEAAQRKGYGWDEMVRLLAALAPKSPPQIS